MRLRIVGAVRVLDGYAVLRHGPGGRGRKAFGIIGKAPSDGGSLAAVCIVETGARALVGVDHRATLLQAPVAGDTCGAVNAARTRGWGDHQAGPIRIEVRGDLQGDTVRVLQAVEVTPGQYLGARNRFQRSVMDAETAGRCHVDQRVVVGMQSQAP